jgi:hypothetical protein
VQEFHRGSNAVLLDHILGKTTERLMTSSVHIDDVALCHVKALDPLIPQGTYLLDSEGYTN